MLIKGGDWFVDGATAIARRFKLPDLLIGATVVSIGTTLPEVMVSATAAMQGSSEMAYGNAIGSIICNTALIAAISIAVKPTKINRKNMILPVAFFTLAAIIYATTAYLGGHFTRGIGITLLVIFVVYMVSLVIQMLNVKNRPEEKAKQADEPLEIEEAKEPILKSLLLLILGAVVIALGADLLVDNGIIIAEYLGVPETVISLTFVALGTSLPELVTAITALSKGHGALSVGNILGANLFNLVFVSGIAISILPFDVPAGNTIGGVSASLAVDIPVMIAVMAIMVIPALMRHTLSRLQGFLLLAIYAGFCVFQFAL